MLTHDLQANGSFGAISGTYLNSSEAKPTGTYPYALESVFCRNPTDKCGHLYRILEPIDLGEIDTTDLAAQAAWHILQGFLSGLDTLDGNLQGVKDFNLWTESYGGHYGPSL